MHFRKQLQTTAVATMLNYFGCLNASLKVSCTLRNVNSAKMEGDGDILGEVRRRGGNRNGNIHSIFTQF